jgi:hypothetical protein
MKALRIILRWTLVTILAALNPAVGAQYAWASEDEDEDQDEISGNV